MHLRAEADSVHLDTHKLSVPAWGSVPKQKSHAPVSRESFCKIRLPPKLLGSGPYQRKEVKIQDSTSVAGKCCAPSLESKRMPGNARNVCIYVFLYLFMLKLFSKNAEIANAR